MIVTYPVIKSPGLYSVNKLSLSNDLPIIGNCLVNVILISIGISTLIKLFVLLSNNDLGFLIGSISIFSLELITLLDLNVANSDS